VKTFERWFIAITLMPFALLYDMADEVQDVPGAEPISYVSRLFRWAKGD
jgi:hypothetical protein